MSRTVTCALSKAAQAKYRATLAINKYEEELDAMRPKLYRDYEQVLHIRRTRFYGWPWGPRVNPPPHPLEVQYKKDNDRAGALLEEQAKLDQRRAQLKTLMQAVDDSVEVEEDVSQNLAKMVQATQELNSLLDRLEDLAEPQGAIGLASISTSPAALQLKAEKLPGSAESPTSTLQEPVETASECPQTPEAGSWEMICKALEEGCAAISTKLRCTDVQWVQQRMLRENLFVDLVGVSGRKLLPQRNLSKQGTTKGTLVAPH
ncbi:g12467 [Coccomyxa viridis]|uniref:G12467 protein n=1 Tax=Coccomyxa viridis TaxID=1274662 RepID=A0ABP1GEQ2_9CHLO